MRTAKSMLRKMYLNCPDEKREEFKKFKEITLQSIKKEFRRIMANRLKFVVKYKRIPRIYGFYYLSNHKTKSCWIKSEINNRKKRKA